MVSEEEAVRSEYRPRLDRLIYVISGGAVVYGLAMRLGTAYFIRVLRSENVTKIDIASQYGYSAILVIYLLTMIAIAVVYRLLGEEFTWERSAPGGRGGTPKRVVYGAAAGLICCAATVPVIWGHGGSRVHLLVSTVAHAYGLSIGSILMVLLLGVALPIASEVVFRGIVLRSFAYFVSVPAAVVASTLLFALWWPVMNWYGSVVLGVISAILYVRTRTLTASVVANSVVSLGSAALILMFAFR